MHPVIADALMVKGLPEERWFMNHVDALVRDVQPLLDRLAEVEAENATLREQLEYADTAPGRRKKA